MNCHYLISIICLVNISNITSLQTYTPPSYRNPFRKYTTKVKRKFPSTIHQVTSTLSPIEGIWKSLEDLTTNNNNFNKNKPGLSPGAKFFQAISDNDIDRAMSFIDTDNDLIEFENTDFPNAWNRDELERNLRLQVELSQKYQNDWLLVDNDVYDPTIGKAAVTFRLRGQNSVTKTGAAFFEMNDNNLIKKAFVVTENDKSGEINLIILKIASMIISATTSKEKKSKNTQHVSLNQKNSNENENNNNLLSIFSSSNSNPESSSLSLPERYYDGWNRRDFDEAISAFSDDVKYDDTAFPQPFQGKDALERHLKVCADAMPPTFSFVLDDKIDIGSKAMLQWHVENDSEVLPFTRGCSFYQIENGKIVSGTDWKEPAVFKIGGLMLFVKSFLAKVQEEPVRLVPLLAWVTYCYVVFISDWFFGQPVQALEPRTWEEVRDLSLNFFLVSPILDLPFSPVVHPGLEAIFNLLLSWAALFAGFLSDDRPKKPNLLPMLPTVIGMQLLTSAFLLPYLATRSSEPEEKIVRDDLPRISQITESRLLGPVMAIVGTGSIFWGLLARTSEFGGFEERLSSLIDLLSIDRVGSSFLVDLAIFALFQGWLVDDDLKRRGMARDAPLALAAKYVPFFGMATYLTFRPQLPSSDEQIEKE